MIANYYDNGQLEKKGNYVHGTEKGDWEYYHINGQLKEKGSFINYGKGKEGNWYFYDENGELKKRMDYSGYEIKEFSYENGIQNKSYKLISKSK